MHQAQPWLETEVGIMSGEVTAEADGSLKWNLESEKGRDQVKGT